jgi:hypothetical protein
MPAEKLDFILRSLIKRSGRLKSQDLVTDDLDDTLVEGFVLKTQVPIRTSIAQLQKMFLFDGVEQDHKIHIESRGSNQQEVTINLEEMGAGIEESDSDTTVEITRTPDSNLPQELVYNAMDVDNDYWQHIERSQRQVVAFKDRNSVILSVVTTADQLSHAVRRGHSTIWIERDHYKMTLLRKFSNLTVGTIVRFVKKGVSHRFRINEILYSPEGLIEVSGYKEVVGQFDILEGGGNSAGGGGKAPASVSQSELFFLDMPIIRVVDDEAGYYVGVGKKSKAAIWKGANVYHSTNDSLFSLEKQYTNNVPYGVLRSDASGANISTWSNKILKIKMISGELFSATKSDVLQDTNVAFILDPDGTVEIIQFLTVVDNLEGTFDLTGNLRGRRGTELAAESHVIDVASSLVVGSVPSDTGITFTSDLLGTAGDQVHVEILASVLGGFNVKADIDSAGKITLVITPDTNANTTAEVIATLNQNASIMGLVTVSNTTGSDGSGLIITLAETALSGGVAGSQFGVITGGELQRFARASDEIGKERFLKAVTVGQTPAQVISKSITTTAKSLFPYSPSQVTGSRDGSENITIGWVRRTRFDGGMRDLVEVPLNETSEEYEVDIMNGAAVVRSITGLSSPTTIYTSAQQVTDFGSNQNPVTVRIYQISSVVGRGFKREVSI